MTRKKQYDEKFKESAVRLSYTHGNIIRGRERDGYPLYSVVQVAERTPDDTVYPLM